MRAPIATPMITSSEVEARGRTSCMTAACCRWWMASSRATMPRCSLMAKLGQVNHHFLISLHTQPSADSGDKMSATVLNDFAHRRQNVHNGECFYAGWERPGRHSKGHGHHFRPHSVPGRCGRGCEGRLRRNPHGNSHSSLASPRVHGNSHICCSKCSSAIRQPFEIFSASSIAFIYMNARISCSPEQHRVIKIDMTGLAGHCRRRFGTC